MAIKKVGRNDLCACGSGKKYKKCCQLTEKVEGVQMSPLIFQELQKAISHHQAGELSEAQVIYQKVLKLMPDNADALHYLGLISYQTGDSAAAVTMISKAIAVSPNYLMYCNLGAALQAQGRHSLAVENYQLSISLNDEYADAYNNLGNLLNRISGMYSGQLIGYSSLYANIYGYSLSTVEANDEWGQLYVGILTNMRYLQENSSSSQLVGIAQIIEGHAFGTAASLWGAIPYSEAGNPEIEDPVFDGQDPIIVWHQNGYKDRLSTEPSVYYPERVNITYEQLLTDVTYTKQTSYHIDYGNLILDIHELDIVDPQDLENHLNNIVGVVTNGLFANRGADVLLIGSQNGVNILQSK